MSQPARITGLDYGQAGSHYRTMDKRELASIVSIRTGIGRRDIERILTTAFDVIRETMIDGAEVSMMNFGTFGMRKYKPQMFKHPRTGESYQKPARRIPVFWPVNLFAIQVRSESPPESVET